MRQARRDPRLGAKHRDEVDVAAAIRADPLDHAMAVEPELVAGAGEVELGHPAFGDLIEELVAARRSGGYLLHIDWEREAHESGTPISAIVQVLIATAR